MDHLTDAPVANILILAGIIFLAVGLFGRIGGFIGSIFGNIEAGKNSRVLAGILGVLLIVGGGWLHEDSHKSAAPSAPTAPTPPGTSAAGTAPPSPAPDVARESPTAKASTLQPSPSSTLQPMASDSPVRAAERERLPAPTLPPLGDDRLVGTWTNLTPRADSIKRIEIVRARQGLNIHIWYSCSADECDLGLHGLDVSGGTPTYTYELTNPNRRITGYLTLQTAHVLHVTIDRLEARTPPGRHHWVFTKSTISETVLSAFATYLDAPGQKAFAMAPGVWSYETGQASADDAREKAMQRCERRGVPGCRIILLNDDAAQ